MYDLRRSMKPSARKVILPKAKPAYNRQLTPALVQRARHAPQTLSSNDVVTLQGTVGNGAVQRILAEHPQAVQESQGEERYEHEADKVARQVVGGLRGRRSSPTAAQPGTNLYGGRDMVQRPWQSALSRSPNRGAGGQGLPEKTRGAMEQAFGANFGGVRIHQNAQADQLNRSLDAHAFTSGRDIYFGRGQFNPGSMMGQGLLAHELTHVMQQGQAPVQREGDYRGAPVPQAGDSEVSALGRRLPSAQQAAASGHTLGQRPEVLQRAGPGRIQRKKKCGKKKNQGGGTGVMTGGVKGGKGKGGKVTGGMNKEDKFKGAYQMARTFHGTHPDNVSSILEQGLKIDKTGTGAMALNSEFKIDEQVVHLELDRETSAGYSKGKGGLLRPFLSSDRRPEQRAKMWGMQGYKPVWPEDVPRKEIVYDEKHRGGGAVWTGQDVPGHNIMSGTHEELLNSGKMEDQHRLNNILQTIGTHYETLYGETPPGQEELRETYSKLVRERRLSMTDSEWFT